MGVCKQCRFESRLKILYSMRYGAAYMLAALSGSTPTVADIERVLSSVGIECDAAKAKLVVDAFAGRPVDEVVAAGMEQMGGLAMGGGGGSAAPAAAADAPAAEAPKAEEKPAESEEESDDDMGFGLFD